MSSKNRLKLPISGTGKPDAVFIGTLPPPVTGMINVSARIVAKLREQCDLRVFDLSHGKHSRDLKFRIYRAFATALAVVRLFFTPSGRNSCFYKAANSGYGQLYDLLLVILARVLGYRTFLHHHAYSYLHKRSWLMAFLTKVMGSEDVHVVLCRDMKRKLKCLYPAARCIIVLNNAFINDKFDPGRPAQDDNPVRIGHISNLTVEKGIDIVVRSYRTMRERKVPVELVLAGPVMSYEEEQILSTVQKEYRDHLDYRGPVYGREKENFYRDIDVMLFPTKYHNEAQPLVINEALFAGVPVISFDRGCIRRQIGDEGGIVVQQDPDLFVQTTIETIENWTQNRQELRQAQQLASHRGRVLFERAHLQLDKLIAAMT